jgi:hypothetical protein
VGGPNGAANTSGQYSARYVNTTRQRDCIFGPSVHGGASLAACDERQPLRTARRRLERMRAAQMGGGAHPRPSAVLRSFLDNAMVTDWASRSERKRENHRDKMTSNPLGTLLDSPPWRCMACASEGKKPSRAHGPLKGSGSRGEREGGPGGRTASYGFQCSRQ